MINVSPDAQLARGWSKDHLGLPPADVYLACDPDIVVARLDAILAPRDADPPEEAAPSTSRDVADDRACIRDA